MRRLHLALLTAALCAPVPAQVDIKHDGDRVFVSIDGKPFTTFYMGGPDVPKPFLHPLRSASGKMVTRGFPMEQIPGEPTDHPHHRGVFFGHMSVNGTNTWANEPSSKEAHMGKVDFHFRAAWRQIHFIVRD